MPGKKEKTTAIRKKLRTQVMFEPTMSEGRARAIECTAIDMSSGGISLRSSQFLEKGSIVKVSIPVTGLNLVLPIFAEVIWSKQEPDSVSMGLRFLG